MGDVVKRENTAVSLSTYVDISVKLIHGNYNSRLQTVELVCALLKHYSV